MGHAQRPLSEYMSSTLLALIICFTPSLYAVHALVTPSTNTLVPPLQWINLTGLLGGSNAPPALKGASLGYDDNSRSLLVFGGESQQGFPVSQTYLLNLDTLTWDVPNPAPPLSKEGPPARSFAISGDDSAASYRHSHIVVGGKDVHGDPLADVWEYDYTNQFWSNVTFPPGGPSARWGAVGGIDIRTPPVQDLLIPGPNNSFYLAGGFDGKNAVPLSDVWRLNVAGTLTSNNAHDVLASWEKVSMPDSLPGRTGIGGTVVREDSDTQQRVLSLGGCATSLTADDICLDGVDFIVNVDTQSNSIPPPCPAPRLQPVVIPNMNGASKSFNSQVFMLLGTFNSSIWDDGQGLQKGEVAVLDVNTRGWTRILPAGDPGPAPGGNPAFPSARSGASALAWDQGLVGNNRKVLSDTIVFGGQDEHGNYLSEVWVLRAYNTLSSGPLVGGVNANGAGVSNVPISTCATALIQTTSSGSSAAPTPTGSSPPDLPNPGVGAAQDAFNTSVVHKALGPISIALLLPAILAFRLSTPSVAAPVSSHHRMALYFSSILISLAAFGAGIGGLASAFTSISASSSLTKRSSSSINLSTSHGRAGLTLFAGLFGLVPLLLIASACIRRDANGSTLKSRHRISSGELAEKAELYPGRAASPQPTSNGASEEAVTDEPRPRARSWNTLSPWPTGRNARRSSESGLDAASSPSTVRSFEVTNRPARARHASAHSLAAFADPRTSHPSRNLSDMSWLERRRSLNTVGDLDYALAHLPRRTSMPPTPGTAVMDIPSTRGLVGPPAHTQTPRMPGSLELLIHCLLHAFLLGLCIVSLIALWNRAPKGAFAAFLAWVVVFYCLILYFASRGAPQESVLSVVLNRISTDPSPPPSTPSPSRPISSIGLDAVPFPSGPYTHHQPPFRVAHEGEYLTSTQGGHGSIESEDDVDDDTRQRAIEEEMSRRDVSIVTVPKRKLFLTNPEIR